MTKEFAAFLIAVNFFVGAVLGLAISKIRFSSRFTLALAVRAAFVGGITFLVVVGLAGWLFEYAHRSR